MHRWATRNAILHTIYPGLLREEIIQRQAVCGEYSLFARVRTALLWQNWAGCTAIDESPLCFIGGKKHRMWCPQEYHSTIAEAATYCWTWHQDLQDNSNEQRFAVQWYCVLLCSDTAFCCAVLLCYCVLLCAAWAAVDRRVQPLMRDVWTMYSCNSQHSVERNSGGE